MTATTTLTQAPGLYPNGSFEKEFYKRLFTITINPAYSTGFRGIASMMAFGHWTDLVMPADLSPESVRAAVIATAKRQRKADRKRRKEPWYVPWPVTFDAVIDTAKNGCRFPKWCRGKCAADNGERVHWGIDWTHTDLKYGDVIGTQIFRIEDVNIGDITPAEVHLSYRSGDGAVPPVDLVLSPVEARKVGEALQSAPQKELGGRHGSWIYPAPGTIIDLTFEDSTRLVVNRVPRRTRRNSEYPESTEFEINLYAEGASWPARMVADDLYFLANHLTTAADDAEGIVQPMHDGWERTVELAAR